MSSDIDQLRRSGGPPPDSTPSRAFWFRNWGLPVLLLAGFLILILLLFGHRLLPARSVDVAIVVTQAAAIEDAAATRPASAGTDWEADPLFQASGWIEPDPFPIRATALVGGVVDEVHVLEGERVTRGQLLATLIADDFEIAHRSAQARLAAARAELAAARADARSVEAEIAAVESRIAAARSHLEELRDLSQRYASTGEGVVSEREITQVRLQLASQEAEIRALEASREEVRSRSSREEAAVAAAEAAIEIAARDVDQKAIDLARTRIVAPVDGVVQTLYAAPGRKRMLHMDHGESATIATLYQPEKLQARIDVPLAEAARLIPDQPVRIRSSLLPDRVFRGRLTRIVGEADLQRNTLQVKVRILDPDPVMRPEMLCRGEFLPLAAGSTGGAERNRMSAAAAAAATVFVPAAALVDLNRERARIWLLDGSRERVESGEVTVVPQPRDGFHQVRSGLSPGDLVVLNPPADLKPGERIRPTLP